MTNDKDNNELTLIPSKRRKNVHVKTARKRSNSSTKWLKRQLNDPYVVAAQEQGFRSRAAYKILQMNEQFELLKPGMRIVDLGAAPGGWSQIASKINAGKGKIVAIDILDMEPLHDVTFLKLDFLSEEAPDKLKEALEGQADLVMSDMAPSTTGHRGTDHMRIMAMAELAIDFAQQVLAPNGAFVCKLFQGGLEKDFLDTLKKDFTKVRHAKPHASRKDSAEAYIVAQGYRGNNDNT